MHLDECCYCNAATFCERDDLGYPECRACRVVRFFECVLYAPKGLRLLGWQESVLRETFGTVNEKGLRQYRQAYLSVPKKNGKSFLVGGLPLYHLCCEDEQRQEAYGAAAAKDQAGIVFRSASHLVRGNSLLTDFLKVNDSTKRIIRRDGGGFYAVISADGDLQDGIEPSLAIMDELHRWKGDRAETLYDVITKGTISRKEPLVVGITTAGEIDKSPICWREHEYAQQVLSGSLKSDRFYARIWGAEQKKIESDPEYWKSREARVLANPSHEDHGGFLTDEALRIELDKAIALPEKKNDYLRYHLNIWVQQDEAVIDLSDWDRCQVPLQQFIERRCYVGVDLSSTTDLTAVVWLFPDGEYFDVKAHFWMPKDQVAKREARDRVPYSRWVQQGFVTATDGPVVDYRSVRESIKASSELYSVQELCFDRWNSRETQLQLIDEGFTVIEVPQTYQGVSDATKKILELIVAGKIRHDGNPVLRWMAGCVSVTGDKKDNIMFDKPERAKSSKRIDGFAAMANAMSRALVADNKEYVGLTFV